MILVGIISALIADIPFRKNRSDSFLDLLLHCSSYSILFPLVYCPIRISLDDSPGEMVFPIIIVAAISSTLFGIFHLGLDFITSYCYKRLIANKQKNLALIVFFIEQSLMILMTAEFASRM